MKFWKYHGLGNDFVLSEDLDGTLEATPQRAARLLNRHTASAATAGCWSAVPGLRHRHVPLQHDGSVAEMCGNGLRCFAKHVHDHKLVQKEVFTVETLAGVMEVTIAAEDGVTKTVTANLARPALTAPPIPMTARENATGSPARPGPGLHGLGLPDGVPHAVVFGTDFTDEDVLKYGPVLETDPVFPRKANINFANILDDHTVEVRTWERAAAGLWPAAPGSSARRYSATGRATPALM